MPVPAEPRRARHPARAAVPRRHRAGRVRPRLLLGRGAHVLADRRASSRTAVGYAGGYTPNPTYEEVCTGRTGHNEVVLVVFDPAMISYETLLKRFWEGHDPTQGMRQGNDVGTQYRSGIYVYSDAAARRGRALARRLPAGSSRRPATATITTEIVDAPEFYYAEDYHQQYLAKNPERLLRPRRHRRHLPDRSREARGVTTSAGTDCGQPPSPTY